MQSGKRGVFAQINWLAGNPIDTIKLSTPIPRQMAVSTDINNEKISPTFSILRTSREKAEEEAKQLFEELDKKSNEEIIKEAQSIDPDYINGVDRDMQDIIESFNLTPSIVEQLKRFRATMTLATYNLEQRNASYGTFSVAGWEIEKRFHEFLLKNFTEEQFQIMLGIAKWQLREKPHPYDDVEGLYWPQSEAFGELSIDKDITSEKELFSIVPYEKLQKIIDYQKEHERINKERRTQSNMGILPDDEFVKLMDIELYNFYKNLRELLTPEEAAVVGYSVIYEEPDSVEEK